MALSDAELRFRPFEPLEFVERSALDLAQSVINEMGAHAALQSDLALNGVAAMTPKTAENLLAKFGVRDEAARAILIELWQHAYKKLLFRDDQVDQGEREYLRQLQTALGLTCEEVRIARSEIPQHDSGSEAFHSRTCARVGIQQPCSSLPFCVSAVFSR